MKQPIYLDYSATTPVDPRVAQKMIPYLTEEYGNPASRSHSYGWTAEEAVERARDEVAKLVNCDSKEIVWTSGATESINLALKGAANFYKTKGKHIITVKTEHKATLDTVRELERQGFEATYLDVKDDGLIDMDVFKSAIRPDTILVSVMFVNNEIGVIQPIAEIGEICREKGIIFHVDAAQATGKVVVDLQALKVDLMSFSAHKTYGPKGMGALLCTPQAAHTFGSANARRRARARVPFRHAGYTPDRRHGRSVSHRAPGNADRKRTHPHAARSPAQRHQGNGRGVRQRRLEHRVPHNLNVSFNFVEGESLIMGIKELAVSSGSACTSASLEPSYVLRALGRNDELAHSSIRFTIGRFTTEADVDFAIKLLKERIQKLRDMSPLWEMYKDGVDLNSVQWAAH